MSWLKEVIGTEKAVIAMCHLQPLPGDPGFDKKKGMNWVVEQAYKDFVALQEGGVDAVMFSNEFSLPYLTDVRKETVAAMARIVGQLLPEIKIPFGINALWDGGASIDIAVATGAKFVREIFTGVYASDFGLWNTNYGAVARHRCAVGGENVKLLFNIVPESARYLADREVVEIAKSTVFNCKADALCVSGLTAGEEADNQILQSVKKMVPNITNEIIKRLRILQPGNCIAFGSAFKVPVMIKLDMPNPAPASNSCDISGVWFVEKKQ